MYDTVSGLQWLTPQATQGLSYDMVVSSGYLSLGYRFATADDLVDLLSNAGFNVAALPRLEGQAYTTGAAEDVSALRALISLLGNTSGGNQPIASNPYSNFVTMGILADVSPTDGWLYGGAHYAASLLATEPLVSVSIPGSRFPTSDGDVGSFLVREVAQVPEPGSVLMLSAGLALVASRARRAASK